MTSGINNIGQSVFQPPISPRQISPAEKSEPITSFDIEDQAIISSQAKLLSELDKFNSGGDNAVELATASVMAKTTVAAEVNVIKAKENMFDTILGMCE